MRVFVLGILLATALMGAGCAHVADAPNAEWTARAEPADAEPAKDHADPKVAGWRTETTEKPAGDWVEPLVAPMSNKGPHAVAHGDGAYLLDSGDQLRVFVYGQPNLSRIYTVDHAGNIMVPLIGVVRAQRRTTYQLAGAIRARLGSQFVRDPQVTVDMHQNRPFFILGEVRTPGQYPYVSGMTVETAVAIAGGYTARADERRFRISRRVDGVVEIAKGGIDHIVRPGDTIKVAERFF